MPATRVSVPPEIAGLKDRIAELSAPDDGGLYRRGPEKRAARTAAVLSALRDLWKQALAARTPGDGRGNGADDGAPIDAAGIGLAAVGSLARGQFGPHSDLDLALIYDGHRATVATVEKLADRLWYPLWDAGISLDHSVRSVQQCEAVTSSDIPAAIGWLTVTAVAGDTELVTNTAATILERWRKAARKRLSELGESARHRAVEFGSLPYASQPHLKEARGGLRDASLVAALATSWLADRPHGSFDAAVERLLDVRDCLHLVSGKETNILMAEYQPRVASLLGLADPTLEAEQRDFEASADLQALLARLGRRIAYSLDSTLSRAQHSLIHTTPSARFFSGLGVRRAAPRFDSVAQGVSVHEGQVVLDTRADVVNDRALPLKVGLAAAERGVHIAPITVSSLAQCPVDDVTWTTQSRDLFVRLLETGPALIPVWEELDMARIPSRLIPEWDAVRNRPSASAVHRFTVDRHMVEVVSRLTKSSPIGDPYEPQRLQELFLAGILHDIGKRRGVVDHCAEGARQATAILYRMGYPVETIANAVLLIREHLRLSDVALTRDPSDAAAWRELSEALNGDPVLLDMLYDLTRADGSSLGATSGEVLTKKLGWSAWRQRVVTQMYHATRSWTTR
ncbi:MAG: nucleotidyltransferase domain-containing protein [Bifidobacteriaceae bacterium]|nr:nucleotidyltransferase domain-containing protein [Bifidobacteriaceae bacterium]